MHEMSYVVRIVNEAIDRIEEQNSDNLQVRRLCVSVGEMTGVLPEYLKKYYPQAVDHTVLEGSELEVRMVPVRVLCDGCGAEYHPSKSNRYLCPECGSGAGRVIDGRDVILEQIELI